MIKAVFFDLDGTLLPMLEEEFTKVYFGLLCKKAMPYGYDKDKLIQTIWAGTKAMKHNDGSKTNESVFWNVFESVYGEFECKKMKPVFDEFYENEFKQSKAVCFENPYATEIIEFCKSKNLKIAVSTSPYFPKQGVVSRLGFLGLNENDFDYITNYSNSSYSKPNPKFYEEILKTLNLDASEVLMFGNSETDDGKPMKNLGAKVFMVGDYVSVDENLNEHFEKIKFEDVVSIIEKELSKTN